MKVCILIWVLTLVSLKCEINYLQNHACMRAPCRKKNAENCCTMCVITN